MESYQAVACPVHLSRPMYDAQAQILFSHPVQYINSAQIRFYTNALPSVLQASPLPLTSLPCMVRNLAP